MSFFDLFKSKKQKNNEDNSYLSVLGKIETKTISNQDIEKIYSMLLDGLYIGEIILLDWLDSKPINQEAPGYFAYTYGINFNNSIKKLKKLNLIRHGTPSESLPSLKVTDLKHILSQNMLVSNGKKALLIERIKENVDEQNYVSMVPSVWRATTTGNQILKKYQLLVWAHKNGSKDGSVSPASMSPFFDSNESPLKLALDKSFSDFQHNLLNSNYGLAENNLIYQIQLHDSVENYQLALDSTIGCSILELTGIHNNNFNSSHIYFSKHSVFMDPIKTSLVSYQHKLNLIDDELLELAANIYDLYEPNLSEIRLFKNKTEYLLALKIILSGTKEEFENLIDKWYKRIPQKYKLD